MKKTSIFVAIVLCFSLALGACGSNSANDAPAQTSGIENDASDKTQQPSGKNNATDTSSPVSAQPDDSSITEYTLSRYRDYSDGVAWVKGLDTWYCIDKQGNILFDLEAGTEPVSDFINGVAVVETDSEFSGITTENKVVASLLKSDYKESKYVGNNIVFVHKQTKTLEGNTDERGLFDMSSNDWRMPLGTSFYQRLTLRDGGLSHDNIYLWAIDYFGGGVGALYAVPTSTIYADLYNYEEDLRHYYSLMYDGINQGLDVLGVVMNRFYGVIDFSEPLSFYDDSPYPIIISDFAEPRIVITLDDNLLFIRVDNNNEQGSKTGIYDMNGNLVADLSKYTFRGAEAVDGQLLALLENPDGAGFTTAFDKAGNMLFEAMEGWVEYGNHTSGRTSDGTFYLNDGFYDINGKLVYKIEKNLVTDSFSDGVLWVVLTKDSGVKQLTLIDKNGETLFETGYVR